MKTGPSLKGRSHEKDGFVFFPSIKGGNRKRGFLVSEMFLVLALAILVFVAVLYGFSESKASSRDNRRVSDLRQISTALALYLDSERTYPEGCEWSTDACWKDFLGLHIVAMPTDPINRSSGQCETIEGCYVYRYCRLGGGRAFVVSANLEKPQKIPMGNNPLCSLGGPNQLWVAN